MITEIRQVDPEKNGENRFEITAEEELLYRAATPLWDFSRKALYADRERSLELADPAGKTILRTEYQEEKNPDTVALPPQWMNRSADRIRRHRILDPEGRELGCFYLPQKALPGGRMCLAMGEKLIYAFARYDGSREVVSFYSGKVQVGQLTRPISTRDNRDIYWLHFLKSFDAYEPVLAFFVIIYDYMIHNGNSEQRRNSDLTEVFTGMQNQDTYHREFIGRYFGEEESDRIDAQIAANEEDMLNGMKSEVNHVGRWVMLVFAVVLILGMILLWKTGL